MLIFFDLSRLGILFFLGAVSRLQFRSIARLKVLPLNNSNSRKLLALDRSPIAGGERIISAHASMHWHGGVAAAAALLFRLLAAFSLSLALALLNARARDRNPQLYEKSFSCFVDGRPPGHVADRLRNKRRQPRKSVAEPRVLGDHVVQFEKSMHTRASH